MRGRELLVDGTFASYYEPGSSITGSVWDALAAPLLALPAARRRAVLLLGLGGGSAARVVRALAPASQVVGVERDRSVLAAARAHFDLDGLEIEVVHGDARAFLERDRRTYDVVIDDVFVGEGHSVHKPEWLPRPGCALAAQRLARGGLLVSNTLDETPDVARALQVLRPGLVSIEVEGYDNRILVAGPDSLSARRLRAAVRESPVLAPTLPRLAFRTRAASARSAPR